MLRRAWRHNDRIRIDGSAAVVAAAKAANVGRVVQESVSMLYPDRGSEWIDEDVPTDLFPMARGNLAAEANANRFSAAGGTGSYFGSGGSTDPVHVIASRSSRWLGATSASC